jgi:beta-glucosidase
MWYPGQEGAQATAALLFGDANPAGKLTQTFPASESQTPMAGDPKRYPGVDGEQEHSEGIFVGYRWYDETGVRPLFPFGHGLSYTSFHCSDLAVDSSDQRLTATCTLTNDGPRAGAEVVQLYLGPSSALTMSQPRRTLAGYQKVWLGSGESRQVRIQADERQLRCWDASSHGWLVGTGERTVWVGSSSVELPLQATVTI